MEKETVISNAKAYIMGTYHGLRELHHQRYLDEFCYRFNRRKFTLQHFDRTEQAVRQHGKMLNDTAGNSVPKRFTPHAFMLQRDGGYALLLDDN